MLLGKKANGDKTVPVSCEEKLSGSDAIDIMSQRPGSSRYRKSAISISARGAPMFEWKGNSRATLRNVQGRLVVDDAVAPKGR